MNVSHQRDGARRTGASEVRLSRSIVIRLTAFALLISVFPIFLISSMLLLRMENMTERELIQSYQWLVSEHLGNVEDALERYESSLRYTTSNTTILEALSSTGGNAYLLGSVVSTEVFKTVTMENHREVRDCIVYSTDAPAYGTRVTTFTEVVEREWLSRGWNGGEDWFVDEGWDGRKLMSFVMPLDVVDVDAFVTRRAGLIRLDLYLDELFAPARGGEREYQVVLLDQDGGTLYSSGAGLEDVVANWMQASGAEQGVQMLGSFAVLSDVLPEYGMTMLYLFDINELNLQKNALKEVIYPWAMAIALVIVLGAYGYFRHFSRRVNVLLEKFRIAGAGDLSPTAPIGGEDEIAVLDRRFGQMLREMDALNRKSYAQQTAIREAKYRNLQLQINPHFLYNTLETISAIGAMHGAFQVCDLCEKLGDIFRYSLGKNEGKYTAVANELRQTQNYIFIQQVRYRFEVFYSVDVDAEEVYMLRFLLQPIVENAVLHGLAKKEGPGTLEVYVGRRRNDLEIRISDDGAGMTEEALDALRGQLREDADQRENVSNIGVWNISQRIRLSYGEPYGVEVQSKPGQGSTFTLLLPMITKGMIASDEVQAADRG
ncbi:MAG: sensor histidine kinase [Candidatus Faecivicinus sp.]